MNILDTLNPWRALRRANIIVAYQAARINDLYEELEVAEELIARGHFRNPETGRIGPKGKTFQ